MSKLSISRAPDALFEPTQAGALRMKNRIVMAALTRNRAGPGLVPSLMAADYYSQRATAGMTIAEATQVSPQAQGYADTPGCYTDAQPAGWKVVTDAVHAKGRTIVVQLWHTGRVSHTLFQKDGAAQVGPSAIRAHTQTFIGAHGYLLDAFLRNGSNHRTDRYGGSIENRFRLRVEVTAAVASAIGSDRLGVRLSPVSPVNDSKDSHPQALFNHVVERLSLMKLAYVHMVEGATGGARDNEPFDYAALRDRFGGTWIVNNGYDRAMALDAISSGRADLVSFDGAFISNPDLVQRLVDDAPLVPLMDRSTLYGGGAHGYKAYPTLRDAQGARLERSTALA